MIARTTEATAAVPLRSSLNASSLPEADRSVLGFAEQDTFTTRDLQRALPSFEAAGGRHVFVDIQHVDAALEIDVSARRARARSTVTFVQGESGFPIIDLVPGVVELKVDGKSISTKRFAETQDPDGMASLRSVQVELEPGEHTVELVYDLTKDREETVDGKGKKTLPKLRFQESSVRFFNQVSDLSPRGYAENFFPTNYEYDQYSQSLNVKVTGADRDHLVISNGATTHLEDGSFQIEFPDYFNASGAYVDVVDPESVTILEETYQGVERNIPMVVYGATPEEAEEGMKLSKEYMAELEETYGAYPHPSWTARIVTEFPGGMEYTGATITRPKSLGHEMLHQWFARGVLPRNGNAGWIDEGIARWRDRGYPRLEPDAPADPKHIPEGRELKPLTGLSVYLRQTPRASYSQGSELMARLDYIFRDIGGLRPVLAELFAEYQHDTITHEMFEQFISERAPEPVDAIFAKWAYVTDDEAGAAA